MIEIQHFIDGAFVRPTGPTLETIDPCTEAALGRVPADGTEAIDAAVRAARRAFDEGPWPRWPAAQRAECLLALAAMLEDQAEELARTETSDNGLPIFQTRNGHVPRAIAHLRYFAEEGLRLAGESFPLDGAYLNLVHREPVGVVGIITPWNGPLAVSTINFAAALAVGNTCVVKPSEKAPLSLWMLSNMLEEAGFPAGVLNVVHGRGDAAGRALVRHPGVNSICFIGASEVGQDIMAAASRDLKGLTLELGGKAPTLVLADADFERALDGALLSVFSGNGEVCTAGSRILVEAPLFDRFLEAFVARTRAITVGDPHDPSTEIGPLIDRAHHARVLGMIERARQQGAQVACGGGPPPLRPRGCFLAPTVLHHTPAALEIMQEEVFGPVACVLRVADAEEAVQVANATRFGLSASIWSRDTARALALARRIRAGNIGINSTTIRDIRAPFGGVKHSGLGRLGGRWSIEQFTTVKTLSLPVEPYVLPRLGLRAAASTQDDDLTMAHDIHQLPEDLPVPVDDGACDHLVGLRLPSLSLPSTDGASVDLSRIAGGSIVFAYPRTGRPGVAPLTPDWDLIPGARGCTPQTCGFRDAYDEFRRLGLSVHGLSTQDTDYQRELATRLSLPFPVLADHELALTRALRLPTFEVQGLTLLRRLAWVAEDGVIVRVFYPVFPPDENAEVVLSWIRSR